MLYIIICLLIIAYDIIVRRKYIEIINLVHAFYHCIIKPNNFKHQIIKL